MSYQQRILSRLQFKGQTYLAASAHLICPLKALEMAPSRESPRRHLRDPGMPSCSAPSGVTDEELKPARVSPNHCHISEAGHHTPAKKSFPSPQVAVRFPGWELGNAA